MRRTTKYILFSLILCTSSGFYDQSRGEEVIRFKIYKYIDTQGIGIEAFRMLIPGDWEFDGGLKWRLDNPGIPVEANFRIRNPRGSEAFEVFPNLPFFWTNNPMIFGLCVVLISALSTSKIKVLANIGPLPFWWKNHGL